MKNVVILLASGTGSRFGGDIPKQFVEINGRMIVEYTIDVCMATPCIDEVVIVVSDMYLEMMKTLVAKRAYGKPVRVVPGGATRKDSCINGVAAIGYEEAKVLIHNAVQPFVIPETFEDCVNALDRYDAVSVGSPSVYTVLELNDDRELVHIVNRAHSVNDLGPECFKLAFLKKVFAIGRDDNSFTNLTAMVLKHGLGRVYVVDGDPNNIKITYQDDVVLAKKILEDRRVKSV